MTETRQPIPHRLRNISSEHPYVAGTEDIFDDDFEKSQKTINGELYNLIKNLPVSDGEDIEAGEAYIDTTDGTVKVKLEEEETEE